jgi:hypothetical protein
MSELDLCIGELRSAAQSLTAVADSLTSLFDNSDNTEPEAKAPPSETKAKPVTLEQVRAILAEKSRSGHTEKVRELLQKHGASKLSEIDPTKFEALLGEANSIGLREGEDG